MKIILSFLATVLLSSCGGSSSSSSGGTPAGDLAGTYTGTVTLTASQFGQSQTATDSLTVRVASNGQVTIIDSDGDTATGSLSGSDYTVNFIDRITALDSVLCEATGIFRGSISGNRTTGTVSGQLCIGSPIPANVQGTFEATR